MMLTGWFASGRNKSRSMATAAGEKDRWRKGGAKRILVLLSKIYR